MKKGHSKGRYDAAAVHDGQSWRLVVLNGEVARSFASPANKLPKDFIEAAVAASVRRIMFLFSGEVRVIDGSIPKNAGMSKVNEQLRLAIAEATGVESEDALVAGMTTFWPGVRKPFTLASSFDAGTAFDIHAELSEAGIACAGFASLEMALLAAWRKKVSGHQSFVALSNGHAFIIPAPRGTNTGPQTVACGIRHFLMDEGNWLTRLTRSAASIELTNPLHVLVLDAQERVPPTGDGGARSCAPDIVAALTDAGYTDVVEEQSAAWLEEAARVAYASKPNRCRGVSLPVVNPWEPRKKFSFFWLVAVAAAILALPCGYKTLCDRQSKERCSAIAREAAGLKPKADKVRKAQRALVQARANLENAKNDGKSRIEMRRPLVAFIDIAHLFCRHAGNSMVLKSIRQKGQTISVEGLFTDPEDDVRLGKVVDSYVKDRNIKVLKNEVKQEDDDDGVDVNIFTLELDCSSIGEASK